MARIAIDLARRIGTVDPRIFGNFIEHLGRCIYGGVFDEGSPLSDARGFRRDVLDAVRPLRMPVLRWPGGNFVSGYHWLDGVGPAAERPRRTELAWYAEESNRFGTNEFIEYCRVLGTEPYICVNMGSGTMDEAQAWVEYCNGTGNTHWANLRRAHGHPEPYRVRYWGLGNEMYGSWQIGHLSPEDYVKKARAFALVMKRTDPDIELIGCGHNGWSDWDQIVIDGLAPIIDWYSIHLYTGQADHYTTVFQSHQAERAIRICAALIERARYTQRLTHPIHIAFDEWNVWYRTRTDEDRESGIEERYDLTRRAGGGHLPPRLHPALPGRPDGQPRPARQRDRPDLHEPAPGCSSRPSTIRSASTPSTCAPSRSTSTSTRPTSRPAARARGADARPRPPRRRPRAVPPARRRRDLRRGRARAHDRRRQPRPRPAPPRRRSTWAAPRRPARLLVSEVNGPDVDATNSFEHPDRVGVREHRRPVSGHRLEYEFPAHSVSVLRVRLAP